MAGRPGPSLAAMIAAPAAYEVSTARARLDFDPFTAI
jgi:hypothetical protein